MPFHNCIDYARAATMLDLLTRVCNLHTPIHRSRSHLLSEHRASKPEAASSKRHKELPKIAQAQAQVNSDDEEILDELDEDDFANLKDSDFDDEDDDSMDDELSVMSDAEEGEGAGDLSTGNDDDDDLSDADLSDEEGEEEWSSIHEDEDEGIDDSGSSHTLSDNEDLEDRYAQIQKKRTKREEEEAKKRHSRLPVFGKPNDEDDEEDDREDSEGENSGDSEGDVPSKQKQKQKSRVAHAPVQLSDDSSEDEETKTKRKQKASQPKANPLGARFGRPAVSDLLEIEDRMERFQAAREELAVLGREIMAEPELGVSPNLEIDFQVALPYSDKSFLL